MKKVFLDTNVLIDYLEGREGAKFAQDIIRLSFAGVISICASVLTFANMAYVLHSAHKHTKEEIYDALDMMESLVKVLPMDKEQLRAAIDAKTRDFEDMLQYQCAQANNCDVIVTRNIKDFKNFCSLPLFTSEEFLATFHIQ